MVNPEPPTAVITQDLITLLERASTASRDRIKTIDASVRVHQESILRLSDERDKILTSLGEAEKTIHTLKTKYSPKTQDTTPPVVPPTVGVGTTPTVTTPEVETPKVGVVNPPMFTGGAPVGYKPEYILHFQGDPKRVTGFFSHKLPQKSLAQEALAYLGDAERQKEGAIFTATDLHLHLRGEGHNVSLSETYVVIRSLVQQNLIRFEPMVPGVRRTGGYVVIPQATTVKNPTMEVAPTPPIVAVTPKPSGTTWLWKCRCLEGVLNHQAWNLASLDFCPLCLADRESATKFKATTGGVPVTAPTAPATVAPVVPAPVQAATMTPVKKGRTLNPVSRHGNYPPGCQKTTRDLLDYLRAKPTHPITLSIVEAWYEAQGLGSKAKRNGLRSMASHILISLASGGYLSTVAPRVYMVKP